MKKTLKTIKNIFVGIFLVAYFTVIILVSSLLLSRNDYGVTQFGDKVFIKITKEIANDKYKEGSLVILEAKEIKYLEIGEEVFIYSPNDKEKSVEIIISDISEINLEDKSPYVTLENTGTSWGEDYIAGTPFSSYNGLGKILNFLETKWVFFVLLIVPCFFILLYEIYLLIVTLKYDDEEDEEETKQIIENAQEIVTRNDSPAVQPAPAMTKSAEEDKIAELSRQLAELKQQMNEEKKEEKKEEDPLDDLMSQLNDLKREYELREKDN
ncbi:MAG: hypothetical protein IJ966_03500 [Bacilli bacterium]|nr:hypothetical protein [Bacilli bacterium]